MEPTPRTQLGRRKAAIEKEIRLSYQFPGPPKHPAEIIIGGPLILVEEEVLCGGIPIRSRESLKKVVFTAQAIFHISVNDFQISVADAIGLCHCQLIIKFFFSIPYIWKIWQGCLFGFVYGLAFFHPFR
jgi:hypothetical protein